MHRGPGNVCLAGTWESGDLEEMEKLRGEGEIPGGRQNKPRCTITEWFFPFRTSGSKGLSLKHQTGWKCTCKPKGKLSSSTKIRCLEERISDVSSLAGVTKCCVGTKLLDDKLTRAFGKGETFISTGGLPADSDPSEHRQFAPFTLIRRGLNPPKRAAEQHSSISQKTPVL